MERKVEDLKVLFSEKQIADRVKELADSINQDFGTVEELTVICVLKG